MQITSGWLGPQHVVPEMRGVTPAWTIYKQGRDQPTPSAQLGAPFPRNVSGELPGPMFHPAYVWDLGSRPGLWHRG